MPRSTGDWIAYVDSLLTRVRPAFERSGLAPAAGFSVTTGGVALPAYDASAGVLRIGLPDGADADTVRGFAADLLSEEDGTALDVGLECVVTRLSLHGFARHLRHHHGGATDDDWVEDTIAGSVAHAATWRLFEPNRVFLATFLTRAVDGLKQRDVLGLPGDIAATDDGKRLVRLLGGFLDDLQREDPPDLQATLDALVARSDDTASRRSAESEVVLLQTLSEGNPALRRTAAELFAAEASLEGIAKVLAGPRVLPADVRFTLASALLARGAAADAAPHLAALATQPRIPDQVAAAAALLTNEPLPDDVTPESRLAELEDAGLADALKLLRFVGTPAAAAAIRPVLRHPYAPARKEAWRLLAPFVDDADAWGGLDDPEAMVRSIATSRLTRRPGLARAITRLLMDDDASVRAAALHLARADEGLSNDICALLTARESDDARLAIAAVLAPRLPEIAVDLLGRVMTRKLHPYADAVAAARGVEPFDRHVILVEQLAVDALARERRQLLAFAAQALGHAEWIHLLDLTENETGEEAEKAARQLAQILPESWNHALADPGDDGEPRQMLRGLALSHPEPFVRAAIILWMARSGLEPAERAARIAEQDPTPTVNQVADVLRSAAARPEERMLTAIEKALFLRTVPLFRSVPTPNLLALAAAMRAEVHQPGTPIVRQGELGDRLHVLYEGRAQARKEITGGQQAPLANLAPGAVFGEMSLFDREPRAASVVSVDTCRTLALEGESFHRLGIEYPEILWEVCRVLTLRLRALNQGVGARPPPSRAA